MRFESRRGPKRRKKNNHVLYFGKLISSLLLSLYTSKVVSRA
jgi:hypothetical protein